MMRTLWVGVALLMGADGGAALDGPPPTPPEYAPADDAPAPTPQQEAALRKLNGFQKADWGISLPRVLKLYPSAKKLGTKASDTAIADMIVANLSAQVMFNFEEGALRSVIVTFADYQPGYPDEDHVFAGIVGALTDKYGGREMESAKEGIVKVRWQGPKTNLMAVYDSNALGVGLPFGRKKVSLLYADRAAMEARAAKARDVDSDDL